MGKFDEGMGRVNPEVGENIEERKSREDPHPVRLFWGMCVVVVLFIAMVCFS